MKPFERKAKNLAKNIAIYAWYSGRPKRIDPINPIYYLRKAHESKSLRFLEQKGDLWPLLTEMIQKSHSTGCEYGDYAELHRAITLRKPRYVLECGSGISSCVIAHALLQVREQTGQDSVFISMEENPYYHEQVKRIFPDSLSNLVTFTLSERNEALFGSHYGCFYKEIPELPYDFVFIDGPTERSGPNGKKCFNADFIHVLQKADTTVHGLIDQRVTTYWALKELLRGADVRYNVISKLTSISATKDHLDARGEGRRSIH